MGPRTLDFSHFPVKQFDGAFFDLATSNNDSHAAYRFEAVFALTAPRSRATYDTRGYDLATCNTGGFDCGTTCTLYELGAKLALRLLEVCLGRGKGALLPALGLYARNAAGPAT